MSHYCKHGLVPPCQECDQASDAYWADFWATRAHQLEQDQAAMLLQMNAGIAEAENAAEERDQARADEAKARDAYYEKDAELARCEGALAATRQALRRFAVQTAGSETDLYSICRICETRGPFRGEAHRPDCLLSDDPVRT